MATSVPAIRHLSEEVQSQIKSSVEITALSDVVERLLHNSLDANSTDIRIELDFQKGFCAIVDNGCGIPQSEFGQDGNLARSYCTSKSSCNSSYGNSGQSLAHISALALVSITSRVTGGDANRLLLRHRTRVHDACKGDDDADRLGASGTSVVVQNLFGGLPVRFKAQAMLVDDPARLHRRYHQLKMRLVAYLLTLSRPINLRLSVKGTPLSFTHKAPSGRAAQITFSANAVQNVMRQAGLVSPTVAGSWKLASAKANGLTIRAAICMEPRPSKEAQFISLAGQPIRRTGLGAALFDEINDIFEPSMFGISHQTSDEPMRRAPTSQKEHISSSLHETRVKGADRWPCFYIRIDAPSIDLTSTLSSRNEAEDTASSSIQQIMALLTLLMEQLLQSQQLVPRPHQTKRRRIGRLTDADRTVPQIAKDSFNGWTRARAAFPSHMEDIRQGLPFVDKAESPIAEAPVDADVQLLIDDIEGDGDGLASIVGSETNHDKPALIGKNPTPSTPAVSSDDGVTWTNPQTRKTVRLNSNSFAIPQDSISQDGPADAHGDCRKCFNTRERQPNRTLPVGENSERLRQWSSSTFNNPTEAAIPSVTMDFEGGPVIDRAPLSVVEETLTAPGLAEAEVLRQVDEKFILVRVDEKLVLIDQHAADERIKVEALYKELCSAQATPLKCPILIECSNDEARRFDQAQTYFASWAIRYGRSGLLQDTIRVTHLPSIIAERCRQEPKILIDLLRKEVWAESFNRLGQSEQARTSWVDRMVHCPVDLLNMTNSRACRSAIMFNDVLTKDQCTFLVRSLASCTLPFQCAHGRPSLAVLTNFEYCGLGKALDDGDFGNAFRKWT